MVLQNEFIGGIIDAIICGAVIRGTIIRGRIGLRLDDSIEFRKMIVTQSVN